jgi:hypothetical protein
MAMVSLEGGERGGVNPPARALRKVVTLRYKPRGSSQVADELWAELKMRIDDEPAEELLQRVRAATCFPQNCTLRFFVDDEEDGQVDISAKAAFSGEDDMVYVTWSSFVPGEGTSTHDGDQRTSLDAVKPKSDTGLTSGYRRGVMRTKDVTRTTVGRNPQLMKHQNDVAREAWKAACKRGPVKGASRRRVHARTLPL